MRFTVSEKDLLLTIVEVLKVDSHNTLANVLSISKLVFDPQWEFTRVVSDQRKLFVKLRVPLNFRKMINENKDLLSEICMDIYINDDSYACYGISSIGVLPIQTEEIQVDNHKVMLEKDSVYMSFMKFLADNTIIDELQKKYLYEACASGSANNILSASVMLGCSAEILLKQLCEGYMIYLNNNGTHTEQSTFQQKVLNAKTAYIRLAEFLKRAEANPTVFKQLGFENINLNFNFLDIIRQTRNDSGHPTGKNISKEEFELMLGNYQGFLLKTINAIKQLPLI
ncbi:hypothetical protein [Bacillus sp. CECT 9360]|uniref:hypothetical protein n=1 Tax=Bacillus sp. CECT 9360 TaxID=2845821 RepID=UPI001E296059|nr:hypothetical protein [Bacillus sp. CECT 9360]CAH0346763.1 hypothetical protein BCI9360_03109 [Bacillus sp. CECT 9360]